MERPRPRWLEARGTHVQYRASLEQDMAAMRDVKPDLALGTTPLVQAAKEAGSRRCTSPTWSPPGRSSAPPGLARWPASSRRRPAVRSASPAWWPSSGGVGTKDAAGYGWQTPPKDPPGFRDRMQRARALRAKAEEAVGN